MKRNFRHGRVSAKKGEKPTTTRSVVSFQLRMKRSVPLCFAESASGWGQFREGTYASKKGIEEYCFVLVLYTRSSSRIISQ